MQSFAGVGVLPLPLEHCRQDVLAVVEIVAVLVLLQQDAVVGNYLELVEEGVDLLELLGPDYVLVVHEVQAILYYRNLQLADRGLQDPKQHVQGLEPFSEFLSFLL